jgi:hypothetical protein
MTKLCSGILGCNYRHTSVKVVSDGNNPIKCLGDQTYVSGIDMLPSTFTKVQKYDPSVCEEHIRLCNTAQ